jgi:hypothetical protein
MASILGDLYRQYKEDTESIAGWLAAESLQCGYHLATVGSQPPQQGPGRLKGKGSKTSKPVMLAPVQHADVALGKRVDLEGPPWRRRLQIQ